MAKQAEKRSKGQDKFKALIAVPFLASVVIHLVIFLLVGSVIIFEGSIPRQLFDTFDAGEYEPGDNFSAPPLMEEEPLDVQSPTDTPLEDAMPNPEEALQPDTSMDIITTSTATSAPSFLMNSNAGMSMMPSESPKLAEPGNKKKSEIAKSLMFDTAQRKTSRVNFFNIKEAASRVLIAVDVSRSMVEEKRGGIQGYKILKQKVVEIIESLNEETAFNIAFFGNNVDLFQYKMTPATASAKKDAKKFLEPYMATVDNAFRGTLLNNYRPGSPDLILGSGGSTRMDLAITAGFEMGADAIFIVSDGAPVVGRKLEGEDLKNLRQAQRALNDFLAGRIEKKDAERMIKDADYPLDPFNRRIEYEEQNKGKTEEEAKQRQLREGGEGKPGYWQGSVQKEEIFEHINQLYTRLYEHQGRKRPVIHCVGYQVSERDGAFMEELADEFRGKFEIIDEKLND